MAHKFDRYILEIFYGIIKMQCPSNVYENKNLHQFISEIPLFRLTEFSLFGYISRLRNQF